MQSAVKAVKNFQNIALATTAGLVGYYYFKPSESTDLGDIKDPSDNDNPGIQRKEPHSLTGHVVDPSKQSMLAKALDTDCEYCLETRRQLFGMFQKAKPPSSGTEKSA